MSRLFGLLFYSSAIFSKKNINTYLLFPTNIKMNHTLINNIILKPKIFRDFDCISYKMLKVFQRHAHFIFYLTTNSRRRMCVAFLRRFLELNHVLL